ncbi:hypothetical protein [Cellulomonas sp. ATA003]|uniref:hypothetical protein n=1 Tax=Cellulomonas sp. ATA003 TaxID=3073064 RepID=UPI0028736E8B|nr:hypothetical protein [Cellulomonas sp. ATA003]WNB85526.1 hypothetical protein REH70_18555 [Cellulomonas sp. ATA003]
MGTEPAYSEHDAAVWHTRSMLHALWEGRVDRLPHVPTTFLPQLGPDERVVARGGFELLTFRPLGDGALQPGSGGFFFATGRGGLAATAAVAGVRALNDRSRRRAAAEAAVPRWVVDAGGVVFVSTHGFYLDTGHTLQPWAWPHVDSMELAGPGAVHVRGRTAQGPVSWTLRTDWAELVFVLWCLARHPGHPQLGSGAWIPAGWAEREEHRLETQRLERQRRQLGTGEA